MGRLVSKPAAATPISTTPESHQRSRPFAPVESTSQLPITSQRKMLSFVAVKNCVASSPKKPAESSGRPAVFVKRESEAGAASMDEQDRESKATAVDGRQYTEAPREPQRGPPGISARKI